MARIPRPIKAIRPGVLTQLTGGAGNVSRSVSDQVSMYLNRLRYTVPFPVTPEQTYFGCMPEVVFRMHVEGYFRPENKPSGKVGNLLGCLTRSQVVDGAPNIVHVSLGADSPEVFWFEAPEGMPSPLYRRADAFFFPDDHPHRAEIIKWTRQALSIEQGIQKVKGVVMKVEQHLGAGGPLWRAVWPELLNFVKLRTSPAAPLNITRSMQDAVKREVTPMDRELTTDLLATCVMLPAKPRRLTAWVNFHSEEYNNE